ncbi:cytochrome P450 [Nocardia higoensis]|uniref:Cytochrome P450 n=2 Tax=Nocardia higoensis TaxID=228599 RepID=A0ABS0DJ79_9NOCA|nr:cytochrome P450 [Nocardia higoensis]
MLTTPSGVPRVCPAGYGSPQVADREFRVPMYTEQFAVNPHAVYAQMRERFGSLVPVWLAPGVPATLVIGYRAALEILHDPEHFPTDPRTWQQAIPPHCPVLPMMQWRPNALRSTGPEHARYRSATVAALDRVDLHATHAVVERIALDHINRFCERGYADLIGEFAFPLVFDVISDLLGCDPDLSEQAATGMAMVFDTTDAAEGNRLLVEALAELVRRKRARPGRDITSWLAAHRAGLTDEELVHQLVTLYGAASEPLTNLIVNTLLAMMTRSGFGGDVAGGACSTRDALERVLFRDPPIANFCMSYPRRPQLIGGAVWVPAHQPVVISLAACNTDPDIVGGDIRHNASHLALGAGPHRCPASRLAHLIAGDAIDQFLDALPEIVPAVPVDQLRWRPGPFHRALEALPVVFAPVPPLALPTGR